MNLLRLWTPVDDLLIAGGPVNQLTEYKFSLPGKDGLARDKYSVSLGAGDAAAAAADRTQINRLLAQARRRAVEGSGEAPVYVQCRRAEGGTLYRSPILDGSFTELDNEGYYPERGLLRGVLELVRAPYWETVVEQELALGADGTAVPQVGGVAIANRFIPGQPSNWVDAGGDPSAGSGGGELPAPVRLQFSSTAAGVSVWRIYAGFRSERQFSIPDHVWDSEWATGGTQQPGASDPGNHGGFFRRCTWNGQAPTRLLAWVLYGSQQQRLDGRWHALFARQVNPLGYGDLFLQARISAGPPQVTLWAGPWSRVGVAELVELGCGQIPPQLRGFVAYQDLSFELWARRYTDGAHSFDLDHVMALCAEGYRCYRADCYGLATGQKLIDDGLDLDGRVYSETAAGVLGCWQAIGPRPMVRPQCNNRFTFLWQGENAARADYTAVVRMWYRPRVVAP